MLAIFKGAKFPEKNPHLSAKIQFYKKKQLRQSKEEEKGKVKGKVCKLSFQITRKHVSLQYVILNHHTRGIQFHKVCIDIHNLLNP